LTEHNNSSLLTDGIYLQSVPMCDTTNGQFTKIIGLRWMCLYYDSDHNTSVFQQLTVIG